MNVEPGREPRRARIPPKITLGRPASGAISRAPGTSSLLRPFVTVGIPLIFFLVLFIFGGREAYHYFLGSSRFEVTKVDIVEIAQPKPPATMKIGRTDVLKAAAIPKRSNLFLLNLEQVKANLKSHAWIQEAIVTRELPNSVRIEYSLETPVAILNADGLYYVNRHGQPFYRLEKGDALDFPLITLEDGSVGSHEALPERLVAAEKVMRWALESAQIGAKNTGDISVRRGVYQGQAPILLNLFLERKEAGRSGKSGARNKVATNRKRRTLLAASFTEKDIDSQVKRADAVLSRMAQDGRTPKLLRLELGKKVVVKIAQ